MKSVLPSFENVMIVSGDWEEAFMSKRWDS